MCIQVFRAPMRPRDRDIPPGAGADFGVAHAVVGIGDVLCPVPATVADAVTTAGGKSGRMIRRFAHLPDGTFVWTYTSDGSYRLGRIVGPWRYDDSPRAAAIGIHHVRSTEWLEDEFDVEQAPIAVGETFARGGRNLQRIHDTAAERETELLWRDMTHLR